MFCTVKTMKEKEKYAEQCSLLQPVQVRYFQALLPVQRRCPLQCPKHKELGSSY